MNTRSCGPALLLVVVGGLASCGSPTGPTPDSGIEVFCPPTLWIGEVRACGAGLRVASQPVLQDVTEVAVWTGATPDIASVGPWSLVTGRSVGEAEIIATYQGRQGRTSIRVVAEDAIRVSAATEQGPFQAGNTVTMYLQGYYSVASADTGRLFLRITDQNGTVATSDSKIVTKGGSSFVLSKVFVVPNTSAEVCRTAVLEVGPVTIEEPQPGTTLRCIQVRP